MTDVRFPDFSVERFHVAPTWEEAKRTTLDAILFICEDIIGGEIERSHMAKVMDLLEATVPAERVEQTKRLMEGILKDLKRGIRDRVRRRAIELSAESGPFLEAFQRGKRVSEQLRAAEQR